MTETVTGATLTTRTCTRSTQRPGRTAPAGHPQHPSPTRQASPAGRERPSRTCRPASRVPTTRRGPLAPRRQPSQRERERERRVSDADASYNGPTSSTRTLNCANPQRKHAKHNTLSLSRPGPSPKVPVKNQVCCRPRSPTHTRPYVSPATLRMPSWQHPTHKSPLVSRGAKHVSRPIGPAPQQWVRLLGPLPRGHPAYCSRGTNQNATVISRHCSCDPRCWSWRSTPATISANWL